MPAPKHIEKPEPRDLRYRRQLFAEEQDSVFDTARGAFVPLPIVLRKLLRHLSAAEFRVLAYLQMRASQYAICFPTLEEIAHELGLTGRKNVIPHLKRLQEMRLIARRNWAGKNYYLILDPRICIENLVATGKLRDEDLYEINELYEDLRQPPVTTRRKATDSLTKAQRAEHTAAG